MQQLHISADECLLLLLLFLFNSIAHWTAIFSSSVFQKKILDVTNVDIIMMIIIIKIIIKVIIIIIIVIIIIINAKDILNSNKFPFSRNWK